jgi:hypothetical protein
MKGDEFYQESTEGFCEKAFYKLANLMKHKYQMLKPVKAARVKKGTDDLLILENGEVFKK